MNTNEFNMNTNETALKKLEKLLEAEFKNYCAKAGPDASAEGFEKQVAPIVAADPELAKAAMRWFIGMVLEGNILEARLVANSDETLMQFLQSRS
jgi:hypothetical protein